MPRDAFGAYSLPAGYYVSNGDFLLPAQHNPPLEDIREALTGSLARDGSGAMLANLNFGGFRGTNLAMPMGLADAAPFSYASNGARNFCINPSGVINQRGATTLVSPGWLADLWYVGHIGGGAMSATNQHYLSGGAPALLYDNLGRSTAETVLLLSANGTSAAGDLIYLDHTARNTPWLLQGQKVTITFWATRTAGVGELALAWVQNFGAGGSAGTATHIGKTSGLDATWRPYSFTFDVPSTHGKSVGTWPASAGVEFFLSAGSDWNARTGSLGHQNVSVGITGVQYLLGEWPLQQASEYYEPETSFQLAQCQRWCQSHTVSSGWHYMNGPGAGAYLESHAFSPNLGSAAPTLTVNVTAMNGVVAGVTASALNHTTFIWSVTTSGIGFGHFAASLLAEC